MEQDPAGCRTHPADDGVAHRRLARAVRPDHHRHAARGDRQAQIVDRLETVEIDRDIFELQHRRRSGHALALPARPRANMSPSLPGLNPGSPSNSPTIPRPSAVTEMMHRRPSPESPRSGSAVELLSLEKLTSTVPPAPPMESYQPP